MAVFTDTLGDMITKFGYYVGETNINNTHWGRDARISFINEAQLDAVTETRCLEETWTSTVAAYSSSGDEVKTLPDSLYEDGILEIYWLDSSDVYHPLREYHPRFKSIQNDGTGTPVQFFRVGRNIHLMPKQDATGSLVIIGQRMPDELVEDEDTSLIPAAYRHICSLGAARVAFLEDDEYGKADRMLMEYGRLMKQLKKYSRGLRSKRKARFILPRSL